MIATKLACTYCGAFLHNDAPEFCSAACELDYQETKADAECRKQCEQDARDDDEGLN